MSIYKKALQKNLRFKTSKGVLSTEVLFDLSLKDLAATIKLVNEERKSNSVSSELDFLSETASTDPDNDLRFEILKDIYTSKKEAAELAKTNSENKRNNEKILSIIASKRDENLNSMSIEELSALLK